MEAVLAHYLSQPFEARAVGTEKIEHVGLEFVRGGPPGALYALVSDFNIYCRPRDRQPCHLQVTARVFRRLRSDNSQRLGWQKDPVSGVEVGLWSGVLLCRTLGIAPCFQQALKCLLS